MVSTCLTFRGHKETSTKPSSIRRFFSNEARLLHELLHILASRELGGTSENSVREYGFEVGAM